MHVKVGKSVGLLQNYSHAQFPAELVGGRLNRSTVSGDVTQSHPELTSGCRAPPVTRKLEQHLAEVMCTVSETSSETQSVNLSVIIVQELCESRGGRPGLSVLTSLLVSVDVKLY